jgi:hypothetical protein
MFWEQSRIDKNDRNFPQRRQPKRISRRIVRPLTPRSTKLDHQTMRQRKALSVRAQLNGNRFRLTTSFRNGRKDRGCFRKSRNSVGVATEASSDYQSRCGFGTGPSPTHPRPASGSQRPPQSQRGARFSRSPVSVTAALGVGACRMWCWYIGKAVEWRDRRDRRTAS